jgi:hypothetical protein
MIPNENQIEMFPLYAADMARASAYEQQLNGTRADDLQVSGNHYKDMAVQPWAVMEAVLTHEEFVGFLKGNAIKYAMRQGKKQDSDDAGKAKHYMMKLKEVLNGNDA